MSDIAMVAAMGELVPVVPMMPGAGVVTVFVTASTTSATMSEPMSAVAMVPGSSVVTVLVAAGATSAAMSKLVSVVAMVPGSGVATVFVATAPTSAAMSELMSVVTMVPGAGVVAMVLPARTLASGVMAMWAIMLVAVPTAVPWMSMMLAVVTGALVVVTTTSFGIVPRAAWPLVGGAATEAAMFASVSRSTSAVSGTIAPRPFLGFRIGIRLRARRFCFRRRFVFRLLVCFVVFLLC